jgi:hypothetical protein
LMLRLQSRSTPRMVLNFTFLRQLRNSRAASCLNHAGVADKLRIILLIAIALQS